MILPTVNSRGGPHAGSPGRGLRRLRGPPFLKDRPGLSRRSRLEVRLSCVPDGMSDPLRASEGVTPLLPYSHPPYCTIEELM